MMKRALVLILLFSLLGSVACVRRPGGVAPSNIPITPNAYTILGPVSGSDCKVNLLMFIPVSGSNYTKGAVDDALAKRAGANALIGITVDVVSKAFILWSSTCTEVRATAVKLH